MSAKTNGGIMERTEEISSLWNRMASLIKKIPTNSGAENEYAQCYARLVQMGAAQPLRKKYRTG